MFLPSVYESVSVKRIVTSELSVTFDEPTVSTLKVEVSVALLEPVPVAQLPIVEIRSCAVEERVSSV